MVDTSCPSRDDTEGILGVVSEQTKHTGIPFLCYEDILICAGIRDARHQSFSASTQPSQTRHARTKRTDFMGENHSHSPVSCKSVRSRHYYLAKSARLRHYHLASDHKLKERSTDIPLLTSIHTIHRASKRALSKKMNDVVTFVFRR